MELHNTANLLLSITFIELRIRMQCSSRLSPARVATMLMVICRIYVDLVGIWIPSYIVPHTCIWTSELTMLGMFIISTAHSNACSVSGSVEGTGKWHTSLQYVYKTKARVTSLYT